LARTSDSGAARFLDGWDALEVSEQLSAAAADAVCEQIGLASLDLLKAVADATIRFSMYTARLRAAVAMPSIVERSIEVALTDQGVADRKMQLQHSGFLPTPAGSQTNIAIMQSNTAAQPAVAAAPKPEETIRPLSEKFNAVPTRSGHVIPAKCAHLSCLISRVQSRKRTRHSCRLRQSRPAQYNR